MSKMATRFNRQKAIRTIAGLAVAAALIYIASFVLLRSTMSVTFLVHGRFYTVVVHHFSHNEAVNRCCYALYWPLHRQSDNARAAFERALFEPGEDEELPRRKLRHFYVQDVAICRRAGLAGFRD
jgi:hypothetical protein